MWKNTAEISITSYRVVVNHFMMLCALCGRSVFSFGADSNGNWHHYWEENHNAGIFHRTGVHNAVFEQRLIERLAAEGKTFFFK